MALDIVSVTVVETQTVSPDSLYERAYTVPHTQLYVLKVELPTRVFSIKLRYRELKQLQRLGIPLPDFPKTTWLAMRPAVVEERKRLIENYLRVALLSSALIEPILDFFGVDKEETKHVIAALEGQEAKPLAQQLNDGELLIQTFNARLLRESNNKVRVIEDFDQRFFGIPRFIRYEFSVLLLADVVPLCGDPVFGSKALDIVYKILSREWVRSHQEFRSALLKLPAEMLATMRLDEYLLGEVRPANSQAFSVFSAVYDFYQRGGQLAKALKVLNGSSAALELFVGWTSGCLSPRLHEEERPRRKSGEWVELGSSECDLSLKHRELDGVLELLHTMLVHVSPEVVLTALTQWEIRKKWDETMRSLSVLEVYSDNDVLVSMELEMDREVIPLVLRQKTTHQASGVIVVEYHQPEKAGSDPASFMEQRYTLTPTLCTGESRKPSGESSNSSDGSPSSRADHHGPTVACVMVHEIRLGSDLRKYVVSELAGERNTIKASCIALKKALELGVFTTLGGRGWSTGSLNAAVDSKILKRSSVKRRFSKDQLHL